MDRTVGREEKLEQIMRLREYQQNNASHVNTMAGMITPNAGYLNDETQDNSQTGISYLFGRKLRLVLCLLLFAGVFLYHITIEPEEGNFTSSLQSAIRLDYSDKVIDFVKDFTYTLDYEKISIK